MLSRNLYYTVRNVSLLDSRRLGNMNNQASSFLSLCLIVVLTSWLPALQATTPTSAAELVRSSDFIGIVQAFLIAEYPTQDNSGSIWRQHVMLTAAEPIKGELTHLPSFPSTNPFPHIWAGNTQSLENPTWFEGQGDYVVFLRREVVNEVVDWVTKVALPIHYRPDPIGKIEGRIGEKSSLGATQVVGLLRLVLSDDQRQTAADQILGQLLKEVATTSATLMAQAPQSLAFDQRRTQIEAIVLNIKRGTSRGEIEKVFPQEDGGLSGPSETRYYAGSEVMVAVPFDQTGGAWKSQNRVNGTIRVYLSLPHFD